MSSSAICGGVISESFLASQEATNDGYGFMMTYVMPDDHFKDYKILKEAGKHEEASKIFEKYAWNMI